MSTEETGPRHVWSIIKNAQPAATDAVWLRRHPAALDQTVADRAVHRPDPLTEEELRELRTAHERWGADPATLAAIERMASPATRVVITGQQPTLLAGPLYVLYKAMAAIELARQLGERHPGLTFVPVFWVAAEDHDFDEIRRVYWPGHAGQLEEFLMQHGGHEVGQMVGLIKTEPLLDRLRDLIEHSTFKTEFRPAVMGAIAEAFGGDATLEDGFCRLLLRLLAGTGLVIVSPLMDWVRRRAQPILEREFARPGASSAKLIERGEAMRAAGFEPALHRPDRALNAFWLDDIGRRYTLRLQDDGQVRRALPQTDEDVQLELPPVNIEELRDMLGDNPRQFSTNVATRPLVQDAILPTVAQVVGPGEAAYLAQVEAIYEDFGVFAPVRWPRPQVTLIEPRVARNLEKFGVDAATASTTNYTELIEAILRRELQHGELHDLDQARQRQAAEIRELADRLAQDNPAIAGAFDKLTQALEKGYDKIIERILYQRQQDERRLSQAIALISNSLHPNDQPQERQLNPLVPFAFNLGLDWTPRLMPLLDYDPAAPPQIVQLAQLAITNEATGSMSING